MQRKKTKIMQGSNRFIIPVLFVLLLDQAIKFFAVNRIIDLEFSKNGGALFGIQLNINFIFVFFAVFLFVAMISFKRIRTSSHATIAFYLMLGGIISNLADRILYGYIVDYINLFDIFSFNIADLAICFGALILSWKIFKK